MIRCKYFVVQFYPYPFFFLLFYSRYHALPYTQQVHLELFGLDPSVI